MSLSALLSFYLLSVLIVLLLLTFAKKRKCFARTDTTLCSTCGTRYFTKKDKRYTRCPHCSSLEEH